MASRNDRQLSLFPPEKMAEANILIIGVGAIGRQVALQLASAGAPKLTLVDFDSVEVANLGPQGYLPSQIGQLKVDATKADCLLHNPDMTVETINGRFSASTPDHNIVFCCVDSIETRKLIYETLDSHETAPSLFIDGRMSAEVARIITVDDFNHSTYKETLFAAEEAHQGSCTARSTIYCANIAAALMVSQLSKHLRSMPLEPDVLFNILAMEVYTKVEQPA